MNYCQEILNEEFKKRSKTANYSLRKFAQFLETSPSYLGRVLKGERGLSEEKAFTFAKKLWKDKTLQKKFVLQARQTQTKNEEHKKQLEEEIGSNNALLQFGELEIYNFISEWYHWTILELFKVKGFELSERWIAKRLGLPELSIGIALERLNKFGIISTVDGQIKPKNIHWILKSTPSKFIRQFHKNMFAKIIHALENSPTSERHIMGNIMVADSTKYEEATKRVEVFLKELALFLADSDNLDSVYYMNNNLIRVDKNEK